MVTSAFVRLWEMEAEVATEHVLTAIHRSWQEQEQMQKHLGKKIRFLFAVNYISDNLRNIFFLNINFEREFRSEFQRVRKTNS